MVSTSSHSSPLKFYPTLGEGTCWPARRRLKQKKYRVPLNFCGSLFLRIGDFLCFAGTNFCYWEKRVFLAGNQFLRFSGSHLLFGIITLSFFEYKQSNTGEKHAVNQRSTYRRSFSLKLLTVKYMYL